MTLLIASVHGEVPDQLDGATLLEIRIDSLETQTIKEELPKLLAASPIPTILTCRSVTEGGMFEGNEEDRIEMYRVALQCEHPPRYIDIEYEALINTPHMIKTLTSEHTGIILSWHDVVGRPRNLIQRAAQMQQVKGVDVIKIVWRARSIRDNLEAFELLQSRQQPMIAMCLGEYGTMSRILAPKFGGFATYASVDGMEQTASGQPTLRELRSMYHYDAINQDTAVYGVIGNNVEHSASPQFHNGAFQAAGDNAVYLPLQIPEGWEHLKASVGELQHFETLHFSGASITIPHKEQMMRLADSCDTVSTKVGATNTVSISNQSINASNTDVSALASLTVHATRVLVLGGGGVARATIVAAKMNGAQVFIATRRSEQARELSQEFSCHVATHQFADVDTIVNCTPVGMKGGDYPNGDPLNELAPWINLSTSVRVLETIYDPNDTPLLIRAESAGCTITRGEEMFRLQAAEQQRIWATERHILH